MKNSTLSARSTPIEAGMTAPNFTLTSQDKQEWSLAEHVKKGDVVLSFVPFAFTGVCSTEMKCMSADVANWTAKGATVVGICCDSPYAIQAWVEREGYSHTILSDNFRDVSKAYGLFWADLNVSNRGTVVIGKSADGNGKVKFVEARPPGEAVNWARVMSLV